MGTFYERRIGLLRNCEDHLKTSCVFGATFLRFPNLSWLVGCQQISSETWSRILCGHCARAHVGPWNTGELEGGRIPFLKVSGRLCVCNVWGLFWRTLAGKYGYQFLNWRTTISWHHIRRRAVVWGDVGEQLKRWNDWLKDVGNVDVSFRGIGLKWFFKTDRWRASPPIVWLNVPRPRRWILSAVVWTRVRLCADWWLNSLDAWSRRRCCSVGVRSRWIRILLRSEGR